MNDTLKLLIGGIALVSSVFAWWIGQRNEIKLKKDALLKKAEDAKTDSDITSVFDRANGV